MRKKLPSLSANLKLRELGQHLPSKAQHTRIAREIAPHLGSLLAPRVVPAVLRGQAIEMQKEVVALAWLSIHDFSTFKRRFGNAAHERRILESVGASYVLVRRVEEVLGSVTTQDTRPRESERRALLLTAFTEAGVPKERVAAMLETGVIPTSIGKRGHRKMAFRIVAFVEKREEGTVARRFRAWSRIRRLLKETETQAMQRLYVNEARKAYAASALGKAKLAYWKIARAAQRSRRQAARTRLNRIQTLALAESLADRILRRTPK